MEFPSLGQWRHYGFYLEQMEGKLGEKEQRKFRWLGLRTPRPSLGRWVQGQSPCRGRNYRHEGRVKLMSWLETAGENGTYPAAPGSKVRGKLLRFNSIVFLSWNKNSECNSIFWFMFSNYFNLNSAIPLSWQESWAYFTTYLVGSRGKALMGIPRIIRVN